MVARVLFPVLTCGATRSHPSTGLNTLTPKPGQEHKGFKMIKIPWFVCTRTRVLAVFSDYPDFLPSSLIVSRVCYNAYKETARATRKVSILCQLRKRKSPF